MGFFDKIFSRHAAAVETDPDGIYAPTSGVVIPLEDIPDEVFSEGILGKGCGVEPTGDTIVAPFNGKVIQIADTKHAIGLVSESGIELLVHIGLETVDMNGDGFKSLVKVGDIVKCGQPLLSFSIPKIKAAGHNTTVAVVVTNTDDYPDILLVNSGSQKPGAKVLHVG